MCWTGRVGPGRRWRRPVWDPLGFEGVEEAFHRGVVPAVALGSSRAWRRLRPRLSGRPRRRTDSAARAGWARSDSRGGCRRSRAPWQRRQPTQTGAAHQPLDRRTPDATAVAAQHGVHSGRAVSPAALSMISGCPQAALDWRRRTDSPAASAKRSSRWPTGPAPRTAPEPARRRGAHRPSPPSSAWRRCVACSTGWPATARLGKAPRRRFAAPPIIRIAAISDYSQVVTRES